MCACVYLCCVCTYIYEMNVPSLCKLDGKRDLLPEGLGVGPGPDTEGIVPGPAPDPDFSNSD